MNMRILSLGSLLRYRPVLLCVTITFWIFACCIPLLSGFFAKSVFDWLSGQTPMLNLNIWLLGGLYLVSEMLAQVMTSGWFLVHEYWITTLIDLTRRNFFSAMLTDRRILEVGVGSGEAISRFSDDVTMATGDIINERYRMVGEGLFAIIALVIMIRINVFITLAAVLPLTMVLVIIHLLQGSLERFRQAARQGNGRAMNFLGEIFTHVLAIKVASAEEGVLKHLFALNETRRIAAVRDTVLSNILESFGWNLGNLSRGLVILLAAQAIHTHAFTVGDFALFVLYLEWLLLLPRRLGRLLAVQKLAPISTQRLIDLLPATPASSLVEHHTLTPGDPPSALSKVIVQPLVAFEINGLTYRHPTTGRGIENLSFCLKRGTLTVITGRVAAGKTTLLQTLLGLLPKEAGDIYWNDERISDPASFLIAPHCAYTPQVPMLFSETVKENVLLGLQEKQVDLVRALHLAVLERDIETLEFGIDTSIGASGTKLSGGQLMRTAAARMFVRTPELLIFDDLSGALDIETEEVLWNRLFSLEYERREFTCLATSHRRSLLERADRILVLKDGCLEAQGTITELLRESEEFRDLWARG